VPMLQCGFVRSNFALPMGSSCSDLCLATLTGVARGYKY
jgi:hypothetical protein